MPDRAKEERPVKTQSIPEIRQSIKDHGYNEVQTFGGWLSVDEWKPYGQSETLKSVAMEVDASGDHVVEFDISGYVTPTNNVVLGCWPLR
jgi:hypothetical protein